MLMRVRITRLGIYASVVLSLMTGLIAASGSDHQTKASASDILPPREAMISALGTANPNPSLGDEAQAFDRLVGAWNADFTFYRDDGTTVQRKGGILFGWVMDGRAIQDLWIGDPAGDRKERTIGTTFRFFDTELKLWRCVFISPQFNYVVTVQGGPEGDRMVLRGQILTVCPYVGLSVKYSRTRSIGKVRSRMMAGKLGNSKKTIT